MAFAVGANGIDLEKVQVSLLSLLTEGNKTDDQRRVGPPYWSRR